MRLSGFALQRSTRRLFVWFLLTTFVPAAALAAAALQRTLAELEDQLSGFVTREPPGRGDVGVDAAVVAFTRDALVAGAGVPLPFHPVAARSASSRIDVFDEVDALEFATADLAGAQRLAERLAASNDAPTRREALLRVARLARKRGHSTEALDAYRQLAVLDQMVERVSTPK